jgi:uncharacterized protein YegP (UPF0339 family)
VKSKNPRFNVYEDSIGQWRWTLYAKNGEVIASGESYGTKRDARRAVKAVIRTVLAIVAREDERAGITMLPVVTRR